MASLNKLAIRGIRSFDDKQISVIEFFSPVTVIVGHNGSGKTTIIECLKYATTGDQPPNTRGGAFVHDPKMANEKEVKAQVKLRFHAANGTRMLAVRNLSVTVKKTAGLTMKTLESILALADSNVEKGGKRGVISTKCAEMDTEIPQLLGVSKAVLENVIFCHQEDSYWPLAEPAALKKKFDDIFEATRYTKALDSIKALRKDRVADLKAEKERLVGLSREKEHSDKLKARISAVNATIAAKEVEYETIKGQYDETVKNNQKFYEYASKFREMYTKIESLQERKKKLEEDVADAKDNFDEVVGTDDELESRVKQFGDHIDAQKQKRANEERHKQDLEEELSGLRVQHTELIALKGGLTAEADAQKQRIIERETLIQEIGEQQGIKGFNHSPLERDKVVQFLSRLGDVQKKRRLEFEKLQGDLLKKTEDYHLKLRQLDKEAQGYQAQKTSIREQLAERQNTIRSSERTLEEQQSIPLTLRFLQDDMEEKRSRVEKTKSEIQNAKYDSRLAEKMERSRQLEEKREALLEENRALSMQSDSRAKLDLKRGEIKTKSSEIQTTLRTANQKYLELTKRDLKVETMEAEVDKLLHQKEEQQVELDREAAAANANLQTLDAALTSFRDQLKKKQSEMDKLDKKLKAEVDSSFATLDDAIKDASRELDHRKSIAGTMLGTSSVYETILRTGKQRQLCIACNRHLEADELGVFEKYLKDLMKKTSKEAVALNKEELEDWQTELTSLLNLKPVQVTRDQLAAREIPALKAQLEEQEASHPELSARAERLSDKLEEIKREIKSVSIVKQHVATMTRLQKEIERAENEVKDLETDLSLTGSTKTADDVQLELNSITADLRGIEKEKQMITQDRDRQNTAVHAFESKLHQLELEEQKMVSQISEMNKLQERVEQLKKEVASYSVQLKETDGKIAEAQAPIQALEVEQRQIQEELNSKVSQAQKVLQELNMSVDKLNATNKMVERYVKEKRARELEDCILKIDQCDNDLSQANQKIEASREVIKALDKEINEAGASFANLRENIRVRKVEKNILQSQAEIDEFDIEEAAKARRNFSEQWDKAKAKENDLHTSYNHINGELASIRNQLRDLTADQKVYKDINKKYTDQLVKVKVSDMANSDLEKYAKALDNAIMKYHSLKMEEVNDSMKHLWNKTYQGTDIDGIKIRSDVEGGASKRSYNYRVVMTKDQVEMDMRGRCSAGQKMLASIIIRLALSDSFGQNCGILALDEPTNALDIENIDALAESLVDIINERKSHSNFQLIIITHDENFLRKLGQSDVMEYYWRVSRDSRQKSVIERQRFR